MSTRVRKGNKILSIPEDAIDRYMGMGFSVIDETGAVVNKATPVDTNTLKMEYTRMVEEIASFKEKVKELQESNDYLTQENGRLTKELTTLKSAPISEKSTTTRKRKQATEEDKAE